jgi:hypothetical protein
MELEGFQCLAQILQKMPAIRDLEGSGSGLRDGISEGPIPIPADDLYARMSEKPNGKRRCLPIRQEVNRQMTLQIQQDRVKRASFPKRKVIDTQHPWGTRGRQGLLAHQA